MMDKYYAYRTNENFIRTIRNLFASLLQASFASSIVDVIVWDVYINKRYFQ